MDTEEALFGDDQPADPPPPSTQQPAAISNWQLDLMRRGLDAAGADQMEARQRLVEKIVGRPVTSLRDLDPSEVPRVLEGLHALRPEDEPKTVGSSWDDRNFDTWIDRM